jgi:hypothetical protein
VILLIFISIFAFQVQKAFAIETAWGSTLLLSSGSGTFESVSAANPTIYVSPGQLLSGTVTLIANNNIPPNCVVPLIGTSSWGENSNSWWLIHSWLPYGSSTQTASVNLQAPSEAGTYYIIFAFRGELTGDQMASATNWNVGYLVWNDGNDIADFSSTQISEAQQNGVTVVNWLYAEGYLLTYTPACAITVVVGGTPVHDVAVTYVVASQSQVTVGDSLPVSVTARNFGTQAETFSVTAYFGTGKIGFDTETVTLEAGGTRTLNMVWDTTRVVPNSYQIGAYASQVPGETNLANNDYPDGTVVIEGLPYPPQNLVAKPMNNAVNLTWSAPDKSDVQDYYIFRGTTPNFEISWPNYHARTDGNKLQFVDIISDDTIYYYKVIANYPEGFSVPSDAVACARLESFKGIANDGIGASTLTVFNPSTCITFQQNFFINTSDASGNRKYYWCQNCVVKAMNFRLSTIPAPAGYATAWIGVWGPMDSPQMLPADAPNMHRPYSPLWNPCPDEINFSSYIDGSSLLMHNSLLWPERFDLGLSSDAYIHTITTDYPPDSSMLGQFYSFPPNFVIVGDTGGGHANFTSGTGLVSCRTKIGDYWHPGSIIGVVGEFNRSRATDETSEGLNWDTHGYFSSQVHSFDEGVFFVPDFDTPVIGPLTVWAVSNGAHVLTVQAECPVYLKLYDNFGRFIGFDETSGLVEAQIPEAVWRANNSICVFDPSGTYYLMVVGIESGTYTLQISWQNETGCLILCNSTETIGKGDSPSWILSSTASGNYVVMENTPLSVSITPLSGSTFVRQSVTFSSTVSGGIPSYSFQWYLNGNPVSGATSNTWTFTPTSSGIYYVYLKITDAIGNTAQSETARITVAAVPVGGYSIPIPGQATAKPITPYIILTAFLTIAYTTIKRKTTRKPKKT